ncbi:hypothetical protein Lal_00031371 [Lupinus albus]|nr:hypothetical protein Lal_00031371 [Lupinus albus]
MQSFKMRTTSRDVIRKRSLHSVGHKQSNKVHRTNKREEIVRPDCDRGASNHQGVPLLPGSYTNNISGLSQIIKGRDPLTPRVSGKTLTPHHDHSFLEIQWFELAPDSQVVLKKALGLPQYPGRIRRAGFRVNKRTLKLLDKRATKVVVANLQNKFEDLSKRFLEMERLLRSKDAEGHQASIVNENIPCTRTIGIGTVHNTQDVMLHNAQIQSNHVRVLIDIVIEDDALLSIPLDEDIITFGGDLGTFVAWSVHLVDVVPTKGKVKAEHSATSPPRVEHASKKTKVVKSKHKENKTRSKSSNKELSGEVVSKNTNFCAQLMKYVQKLPTDYIIIISITLPVFWFVADEYIGIHEVKDIYDHDWIGASAICALNIYKAENIRTKYASNITWTHVKTPCQTNDKYCDYNVMNFMKEVIRQWPNQVQLNVNSYTKDQINQIREVLSKYVLSFKDV